MPEQVTGELTLAESKELIRRSFGAAQRSGKPDWNVMTSAVLKNRMLALSDQRFDEKLLGYSRFLDFLIAVGDVVSVDGQSKPPLVRLVGPASRPDSADISDIDARVRRDLWVAVVDYTSEVTWVWDSATGTAVSATDSDQRPAIPTFERSDLVSIRRDFIDSFPTSPVRVDRWDDWIENDGATAALPANIRGRWNSHLKRAVYSRLRSFFLSKGLPTPPDLISVTSQSQKRVTKEGPNLRDFVLRVVNEMTLSELQALRLPAGAAMRAAMKP